MGSDARNSVSATPAERSSNASTPSASGTIVTKNSANVTQVATTIQRHFTGSRLLAEQTHGRELAPRDRLEPRRQSVVRELVERAPARGRTHAFPQLVVLDQLRDRRAHPADISGIDDE